MRGDIVVVFVAVFLPLAFIATYFMATGENHVEKEFPYISDTGTYPPESCVFGFLLAIYSVSTYLVVQGRWEHVNSYHSNQSCDRRLNSISFVVGIIAALGCLVVATFQETSVISVHLLGALMAFGVGGLYMWIQTFVSYRMPQIPGTVKLVCHLRLLMAFLATVSMFLTFGFAGVAAAENNNTKTSEPGSGIWYPHMKGYDNHVASASFEWAMAGLISLYFLSFAFEFRHLHIGLPAITIATPDGSPQPNSGKHTNVAYTEESGSGGNYGTNDGKSPPV